MTLEDELESPCCPECKSTHLIKDEKHGETVCGNPMCSIVLSENNIDHGPEWRAFDTEENEKKSRTGLPMTYTLHDKGLSTEIGWKNRDIYGKEISPQNKAQMFRMRKWQRYFRVSNALERNLRIAFFELHRLSSLANIPRSTKERAAMIYRRAAEKHLARGRSINGLVAAALFHACGEKKETIRTIEEIAKYSAVNNNGEKYKKVIISIRRDHRILVRELGLNSSSRPAQHYIPKFCADLKRSPMLQKKAFEVLESADEEDHGKNPIGTAIAAIYIASLICKEKIIQEVLKDISGITTVTIRTRYKCLADKIGIFIDGKNNICYATNDSAKSLFYS